LDTKLHVNDELQSPSAMLVNVVAAVKGSVKTTLNTVTIIDRITLSPGCRAITPEIASVRKPSRSYDV